MLKILHGTGALAVLALAALSVPARAAIPAAPGVVNYVEGSAFINGQAITSKDIGRAEVNQNQILATGQGKAEMLLTPGVLLRSGPKTEVRMLSSGLTDTRVEVLSGEAMVEATDLHKENHIRVLEHGVTTTLLKNGLYDFDANAPHVAVFDGKAEVQGGDNAVKLGKGKQVMLTGHLKAVSFNRDQHDNLYDWSSVRSQDLSVASAGAVGLYGGYPYGSGWYGTGWYWNPYFASYSFIPGDGFLYSPFGFGFYSPLAFYGGYGFYGNRYGYYRGGGGYVTPPTRGVFRGGSAPVQRGFSGGGSSGGGFSRGGVSGGGGGFHGGGRSR
jgi:uncharacterized membrane protein YgcG